MENLLKISKTFLHSQKFDALSVGVIDFQKSEFRSFELYKPQANLIVDKPFIYYDLASLSKPLTNGLGFLDRKKDITADMNLVLNHRGGLPAWGLLPHHGWKDIILSYPISPSETLYSDYSALRFMLEFENQLGLDLHKAASKYWHPEVLFWKDLTSSDFCLQNGYRQGKPNLGKVHDPNAFTIDDKVSHAGLFGTINGVCQTLLKANEKLDLLKLMQNDIDQDKNYRFVNGWDRATDPSKTLAGSGGSEHIFGHLGFTGTSIWIDPVKNLGHVILTNATKFYWYDKQDLNQFRRKIGKKIWQKNF